MAADGVRQDYFVATGTFTSEAMEFAKYKPLKLITGEDLLEKLNSLDEAKRARIYDEITMGDHTTPTCPSCDTKMVRRKSKHGAFWGCMSFSKCRQTFQIRTAK